jgi:hypothetical protein
MIVAALNYWWELTPRCWAFLEKQAVAQSLKNIPTFYGTRRFITVFTRAIHWSLSWARWIKSIPPHPTSLRSILLLSSHLRLGLPSGLFPSGFPTIGGNYPHLSRFSSVLTMVYAIRDYWVFGFCSSSDILKNNRLQDDGQNPKTQQKTTTLTQSHRRWKYV